MSLGHVNIEVSESFRHRKEGNIEDFTQWLINAILHDKAIQMEKFDEGLTLPKRKPPSETVADMSQVTFPVSVCSMESPSSFELSTVSICEISPESLSFDSASF
jgi:hypothetical protein